MADFNSVLSEARQLSAEERLRLIDALWDLVPLDAALEKIAAEPERFARTCAGCRYCALHRYPYCVVYHRTQNRVVVVVIAHAKRRPGYWRSRL